MRGGNPCGKDKNMKEFTNAAMASDAFKDYNEIITDMVESGEHISLSDICGKRNKYANMIIDEVGVKDSNRNDAFEFAHKIIRIADMIILKNAVWVDDTDNA